MSKISYSEETQYPVVMSGPTTEDLVFPYIYIGMKYINKDNGSVSIVTNIQKQSNGAYKITYEED
jgi:hypothetical protein